MRLALQSSPNLNLTASGILDVAGNILLVSYKSESRSCANSHRDLDALCVLLWRAYTLVIERNGLVIDVRQMSVIVVGQFDFLRMLKSIVRYRVSNLLYVPFPEIPLPDRSHYLEACATSGGRPMQGRHMIYEMGIALTLF